MRQFNKSPRSPEPYQKNKPTKFLFCIALMHYIANCWGPRSSGRNKSRGLVRNGARNLDICITKCNPAIHKADETQDIPGVFRKVMVRPRRPITTAFHPISNGSWHPKTFKTRVYVSPQLVCGYAWATPPQPVRVGKVGSDYWSGSYRDGEWGTVVARHELSSASVAEQA